MATDFLRIREHIGPNTMSDQEAIFWLVRHLPHDLQREMIAAEIDTIDRALTKLHSFAALKMALDVSTAGTGPAPMDINIVKSVENNTDDVNYASNKTVGRGRNLDHRHFGNQSINEKTRTYNQSKRLSNIKCFRCGGIGHVQQNCPSPNFNGRVKRNQQQLLSISELHPKLRQLILIWLREPWKLKGDLSPKILLNSTNPL